MVNSVKSYAEAALFVQASPLLALLGALAGCSGSEDTSASAEGAAVAGDAYVERSGDYNGCEDASKLPAGFCAFDEKSKDNGKVPGLTTESMRTAAMLFVDKDGSAVNPAALRDWYVSAPDITSERGCEGIAHNPLRLRVGFDNILVRDDGASYADDTISVFLQTLNGMRSDRVDINDDFDDNQLATRAVIASAMNSMGMDSRWDDRMVIYLGNPFFLMRAGFVDKDIQDYRAVVQQRLSSTKLQKPEKESDALKHDADGVLALVYAFAPTKVSQETLGDTKEDTWVAARLKRLGELTNQVGFAKVLTAGYSLHRANDILDELRASAGKNEFDVDAVSAKKDAAKDFLTAVFNVIGHSDAYNAEHGSQNSAKVEDLFSHLIEDQKEFVRIMRERGEAILEALEKIDSSCDISAKDCTPKQNFDAEKCACVNKATQPPAKRQPPRTQPPKRQPPPQPTATTPPPAKTAKTIPNPF